MNYKPRSSSLFFTPSFNTVQAGAVLSSNSLCQLKDTQHISSILCYKNTALVTCSKMLIIVQTLNEKNKCKTAILGLRLEKPVFMPHRTSRSKCY